MCTRTGLTVNVGVSSNPTSFAPMVINQAINVVITQAINVEFTHSPARLQWFITATGIIYLAFAYFVPTISAMRNWLATSAALTLAYDVALLAILIRDGDHTFC